MEVAAFIISVLSLLAAAGAIAWSERRWRAERRTDVRVLAWHDGVGMDIYSADTVEVQHVIAVRVFNHGERPEHVMWTGLESLAGENLIDDRPKAKKIVDDPPPEPRELSPRGQIATQFKVSSDVIADGFVGYAVLGTHTRVYSAPSAPEQDLEEMQGELLDAISEEDPDE